MATTAPVSEPAARGKRARKQVSCSSHRDWAPYADQNERDYESLQDEVKAGRLTVA